MHEYLTLSFIHVLQTATIEGGAIVSDVDEALQQHGFILPLGSFPKLGVAGMTLMGGLGFTTRSYGITSDNVLEYGKNFIELYFQIKIIL